MYIDLLDECVDIDKAFKRASTGKAVMVLNTGLRKGKGWLDELA